MQAPVDPTRQADREAARLQPLAARVTLAFAALDAAFKPLVGLAFLMLMGIGREAAVSALALRIVAPVWLVWLATVWFMVRPLDRFAADEAGATAEALEKASARCSRLPLRLALLWSVEWAGTCAVLIAAAGGGPSPASLGLFVLALVLGPFPLAHAMTVWLTMHNRSALDLLAHRRGVTLPRPRVTIRGRLTVYALCMTVAPAAYMAAIGVGGRVQALPLDSLLVAMAIGFLAVGLFAVILTLLISLSLTRPISDITRVVRAISTQGEAQSFGRVPSTESGELGELVRLTNDMIQGLELARIEREVALNELEAFAENLERRVAERTQERDEQIAQRARLTHEVSVAQGIQTALLPRQYRVEGLEIAAKMVPATEVGGDYFDILPVQNGGFIGIGDVSGHGIGSGLIMLMLQSITATLVESFPTASARQLTVGINRVLSDAIRKRLGLDDFVTFTLLKYEAGGVVRHAGAHQDLIVWRAATGRCERIATLGTWLGVDRTLDDVFPEQELRLAPGDLLVLYTDGVVEAMDGTKEEFGTQRLCEAVEGVAREAPVEQVVDAVIGAVGRWCSEQKDDMSIVVARRA